MKEEKNIGYDDLFPSVADIMRGKNVATIDPHIWLVIGGKHWQGEAKISGGVMERFFETSRP